MVKDADGLLFESNDDLDELGSTGEQPSDDVNTVRTSYYPLDSAHNGQPTLAHSTYTASTRRQTCIGRYNWQKEQLLFATRTQ